VLLDAIVLAGGRSSRLSGTPKSGLVLDGATLLERTVLAASDARHVAVVGDPGALPPASLLSPRLLLTRETPEYAGPAAGIAAGMAVLDALAPSPSDGVLVLACDMPSVATAVVALLAATSVESPGAIAVDAEGHPQFLTAVYPTRALADALAAHADALEGLPVRALLASMTLLEVRVPRGSTDDVDTWEDAARLGVVAPEPAPGEHEIAVAAAAVPPATSVPPAASVPSAASVEPTASGSAGSAPSRGSTPAFPRQEPS